MDTMSVKEAIKTAIQMEKDGYAFYVKAAAQTSDDMGRQLFESLANDEKMHLATFQKLFEDQIDAVEWNVLVNSTNKYADIPVFPKDLKQVEGTSPDTNELDALNMAMEAESQAVDFYGTIQKQVDDINVKKIIEEIIHQEKIHFRLLSEEFNHLSKTGYWYGLDILGG